MLKLHEYNSFPIKCHQRIINRMSFNYTYVLMLSATLETIGSAEK